MLKLCKNDANFLILNVASCKILVSFINVNPLTFRRRRHWMTLLWHGRGGVASVAVQTRVSGQGSGLRQIDRSKHGGTCLSLHSVVRTTKEGPGNGHWIYPASRFSTPCTFTLIRPSYSNHTTPGALIANARLVASSASKRAQSSRSITGGSWRSIVLSDFRCALSSKQFPHVSFHSSRNTTFSR